MGIFQNKAQVSLFVIIGVILVIVGIFIFTKSETFPLFKDQTPGYKTTQAINEFVLDCMELQTKDGVYLLGRQGGKIYLDNSLILDENKVGYIFEKSQGFKLLGETPLEYWDYYDDANDEFKQKIPSYDSKTDEKSMLMQLKFYLDDTLNKKCLNDFKSFNELADINFDLEDIDHNVEFKDDEIEVSLNFPIEINHKNLEKVDYLNKFEIKYENKLRVPYHLAKDIVNTQKENSLFEKNILATLIPYQSTQDTSLLPPFAKTTNSFDMKIWKIKVK